jgi:hypothetical protein
MPSNLRCSRPVRDCLAKKKLKAFNFKLADPQNRLFAGPGGERERSPTNEVSFSSRDLCSSRFAGRHGAPCDPDRTGDGGGQRPSSLRCSRPARDASPKKVEGIQILDLQIRRIDCLLSYQRERSLQNEVLFSSREFFVPAVSLGRHGAPCDPDRNGDGRGGQRSSLRCSGPARDASSKKVEGV